MSNQRFAGVCLAILASLGVPAQAANRIWANSAGNTDWLSTASWTGGNVPTPADVAEFPSSSAVPLAQPSLAGTTNVNALLFHGMSSQANSWQINGSGTLIVQGSPGTTGYGLNVDSTSFNTKIYPNIVLAAPQTWSVNLWSGNPAVYLYGTLSGTGPLTKYGTFPLIYENTIEPSFTGGLIVTNWSVTTGYVGAQWNLLAQSADRSVGFGPGPIRLGYGGFGFYTRNNAASLVTLTLTNSFTVDTTGGRIYSDCGGTSPFSRNVFSGPLTLNGFLLLDTGYSAGTPSSTRFTGQTTIGRSTAHMVGLYKQWNSISAAYENGMRMDFDGNIADSGSGSFRKPLILRNRNSQVLAIQGTANTYAGGTVVEMCGGNDRTANCTGSIYVPATATLGAGDVLVLPGGRLRLMAAANVPAGKVLRVQSTPAEAGLVSIGFNAAPTWLSSDSDGILAVEGSATLSAPLDMATLGNGKMYLGGMGTPTYSATTLGPCVDKVYRLGAGSGLNYTHGTLNFSNAALALGDVGGPCSMQVGRAGYNGDFGVYLRGNHTFSGKITVTGHVRLHDENGYSTLQTYARTAVGSTPLGAVTGDVHLQHGRIWLEGVTSGQTVVKNKLIFEGQSIVAVNSLATAPGVPTQFTFDSMMRTNNGTLFFSPYYSRGGAAEKFLLVNTNNVPVINGICPAYLMASVSSGLQFLTYKAAAGFTNFNNYAAMPYPGNGTAVVSHTGAITGSSDIWALKTTGAVTGTGLTITNRSGGLILADNFGPNINFLTAEGVICATANNAIRNITGKVSGSGGITHCNGGLQLSNVDNDFTGLITISHGSGGYPGPMFKATFDTLAGNVKRGLGNVDNDIYMNGGALGQVTSGDALLPTRTVTLGPLGGYLFTTFTVHGPITGPGYLYVVNYANQGNANITLNSAAPNNYAGGTRLLGTLTVNSTSSLGTGPVVVEYGSLTLKGDGNISTGARLHVYMTGTATFQSAAPAVGSLTGAGNVVLGTTGVDTTLTVGQDNTSTAFYGTITPFTGRTCGVTKAGSGTWTLYGAHTYTGTTTVNAGRVKLAGSLAGGLTVGSSGGLAVDVGPDGATYGAVAGAVNLGGTLEVTLASGYTPPYNATWTIIGGASSINGDFSSVSVPGFEYKKQGSNLILSYPPRGSLIMIR